MKRVVIVRHAKAVPYGYENDFKRALTERGEADAEMISNRLKAIGVNPGRIVASPARRAKTTASIFAHTFGIAESEIIWYDDFYDGVTTSEFVDFLQGQPDGVDCIFVFGHNPTVHALVYNLLQVFSSDMPTCSTVGIDFSVDSWTEIEARSGTLAFHLFPRMFR